ncbi:MAG: hypothetical protein WD491_10350 [Balneolales bacterium]
MEISEFIIITARLAVYIAFFTILSVAIAASFINGKQDPKKKNNADKESRVGKQLS